MIWPLVLGKWADITQCFLFPTALAFPPFTYRYLGYLIQPKPLAPRHDSHTEVREREREQSRMPSLSRHYSIVDIFSSSGQKSSTKSAIYPKDLIKVLEGKLEVIAMGKDPACVITDRP
jgi:hypothetical protein